jgi:chitinase
MNRTAAATPLRLFLIAVFVGTFVPFARAEWPKRVFAPYMYIGAGDDFKLTACDDACGLKYYTLAFFIARQQLQTSTTNPTGNPATNPAGSPTANPTGKPKDAYTYFKELAWDGTTPVNDGRYADQIAAIRQRGGDVIASFGGQAGKEIAIVETDPAALQAQYQSAIDKYKFTWLDFDIEGDNLALNRHASERRNIALAALQKKNPGLMISFTLPVDPNGILDVTHDLLADAVAKGVDVHSANLMVMWFGDKFVGKGKTEGELGIESALKAHEQILKISPNIQIGLCPCLGRSGRGKIPEIFGVEDAHQIKVFADQTPWVCSLHFWSINDDSGQPRRRRKVTNPAWTFAKIFEPFTSTPQ